MSLEDTFNEVTHSSDKWQPYFEIYERHLTRYKLKDITLIEVGVQKGGSLEMWSNWLNHRDKTRIIGIDVDPVCANLKYEQKNIEVVIGDQGDPKFWDDFIKRDIKFDVFIDDGGHFMDPQILTFEKMFPRLNVGGIYICEDCHTSYMPYNGGGFRKKGTFVDGKKKSATFIEYAKRYVDMIHHEWWEPIENTQCSLKETGKDLTGIFFYDSVVVFEKFGKRKMHRVHPKQFGTPQ